MKRVLIVDDEKRIRELYARVLRSAGISVIEASDAWEATEVLMREPVDLILLDIRMPEIDGAEMYEVLQEYNPNLKIIVSSVYPVDKQRLMIPNALDYFDKSRGSYTLLEKINEVLL